MLSSANTWDMPYDESCMVSAANILLRCAAAKALCTLHVETSVMYFGRFMVEVKQQSYASDTSICVSDRRKLVRVNHGMTSFEMVFQETRDV